MALRIVTQLPQNSVEKVIDEISFTSALEDSLTPRTKKTLLKRLANHQLALAYDDKDLAGWGLVEPLSKGVVELGFLFVKPAFRHTNAFALLARELVLRPETVLFATYDRRLFDYVTKEFGFRESSLQEVNKISRGRFLLKRMNFDAVKSISKRLETKQPIYAVLERS